MGRKRAIICFETEERFESVTDAANAIGAAWPLVSSALKRHGACRGFHFYFVDDEYNPFVRHAPVKTTEKVFRFFANSYRREHGAEPEVTGNRKPSERDILSGMGAVSARVDS